MSGRNSLNTWSIRFIAITYPQLEMPKDVRIRMAGNPADIMLKMIQTMEKISLRLTF